MTIRLEPHAPSGGRSFGRERLGELLFCLAVLAFCLYWAYRLPLNGGPDEEMRLDVSLYIYRHGALPHGGDPEIRNWLWGISYAFLPCLSGILSGLFMRLAGLFTADAHLLLFAARTVSSLFIAGSVYLAFQLGRRLLEKPWNWLFAGLVGLLPQVLFLGAYMNNDASAIFAGALIVNGWLRCAREDWSVSSCVRLGVDWGICALSYLNAYGYLLCSVAVCPLLLLTARREKPDRRLLPRAAGLAIGACLLVCGWWFIRNAVLYDGDFLGLSTSNAYGELYAAESLKPSVLSQTHTLKAYGWSLWEILTGEWGRMTFDSFVGCFGFMSLMTSRWVRLLWLAVFCLGGGACLAHFRGTFAAVSDPESRQRTILHGGMAVCALIPVLLTLYMSYYVDYEPQGRYCMPGLIPFMYFVAKGYSTLGPRLFRQKKVQALLVAAGLLLLAALSAEELFRLHQGITYTPTSYIG